MIETSYPFFYTVTATSTSGRDGTVSSMPTDGTGHLYLRFRVPKAMGGNGTESGYNPEQLLAAGHASKYGSFPLQPDIGTV